MTSATLTQLVVTVPTGATTGVIKVTTSGVTSTSAASFTVTSSGSAGAPTITNFTPTIGTAGTAVTITGTNYDLTPANDKVGFNTHLTTVSSATATTITTVVPSLTGSGPISVATSLGQAVGSGDFIIPPASFTAADVGSTGRIVAGGSSQTITIGTGKKVAVLLFDGTAGQKVSVWLQNSTIPGCSALRLSIFKPDNTELSGVDLCNGTEAFLDAVMLPTSGTYTVVVQAYANNTGQATVSLYTVADVTGSITANSAPQTVTIATPGQNAVLSFSGTAGQKVSTYLQNSTIPGCSSLRLSIFKPDNTELSGSNLCNGTEAFLDAVVLPTSGTYTVVVNPSWRYMGQFTLALYTDVDVTGSITAGAAPQTINITTPGQNAVLSFSGTAGQKGHCQLNGSSPDTTTIYCGRHFFEYLVSCSITLSYP